MLVIISVPASRAFRYRAAKIGCDQAMKSAGDGLIIEYLGSFTEQDTDEARDIIAKVMPARENICPSGGNVYIIKNELGIFEPVCGLHDDDVPRRTRLNASYAKEKLETERRRVIAETGAEPESVEITVNGKTLTCIFVTEEEAIHRGTATTNGYKGVVAYYGAAGNFTFSAKTAGRGNGTAKEGEVCYFLYADEQYCAIWRSNDGWDGDAYTPQAG